MSKESSIRSISDPLLRVEMAQNALNRYMDSRQSNASKDGRLYLIIDPNTELIGVTSNKKLASSMKEVTTLLGKYADEIISKSNSNSSEFKELVITMKELQNMQKKKCSINKIFQKIFQKDDFSKILNKLKTINFNEDNPLKESQKVPTQLTKLANMEEVNSNEMSVAFGIDLKDSEVLSGRKLHDMDYSKLIEAFDATLSSARDSVSQGKRTPEDACIHFENDLLKCYEELDSSKFDEEPKAYIEILSFKERKLALLEVIQNSSFYEVLYDLLESDVPTIDSRLFKKIAQFS